MVHQTVAACCPFFEVERLDSLGLIISENTRPPCFLISLTQLCEALDLFFAFFAHLFLLLTLLSYSEANLFIFAMDTCQFETEFNFALSGNKGLPERSRVLTKVSR